MSQQSELYQNLHLFGGISGKDSAEIHPEIQAQLDKLLTSLAYTISDIVAEGYPVDIDALARLIQEGETVSVVGFEKESHFLGLLALLTTNISQEQLSSLSSLEQTMYAQLLEGLATKRVSDYYITLKRTVDQTTTLLFANRLQIDNLKEFAQSLRNALTQVQFQGDLE